MERTAAVRAHRSTRAAAPVAALVACLLAPGGALAVAQPSPPTPVGGMTAALEQCLPSSIESERSATFIGEMTAIAGTAKMAMRIDVEERTPEELEYHTVTAPGLGVWRASEAKVKTYKYLKQVTNLAAPASYRALVRFRWFNAKGHVIKRAERQTPRCVLAAGEGAEAGAPEGAGRSSTGSTGALAPSS